MAEGLSLRQRQVLAFITEMIEREGYAPTTREIAAVCGLASANGAAHVVSSLVDRGLLLRCPRRLRGLELAMPSAMIIDPAPVPQRTVRILNCSYLFEEVHLSHGGRFVALTPDLTSLERLYRLYADRAAQLQAVEQAILRCRATGPHLSPREHRLLTEARNRTEERVLELSTWEQYLVHEEYVSEIAMAQLDDVATHDESTPLAAMVGSAAAAHRCHNFATQQLHRFHRIVGDADELDVRITAARLVERERMDYVMEPTLELLEVEAQQVRAAVG